MQMSAHQHFATCCLQAHSWVLECSWCQWFWSPGLTCSSLPFPPSVKEVTRSVVANTLLEIRGPHHQGHTVLAFTIQRWLLDWQSRAPQLPSPHANMRSTIIFVSLTSRESENNSFTCSVYQVANFVWYIIPSYACSKTASASIADSPSPKPPREQDLEDSWPWAWKEEMWESPAGRRWHLFPMVLQIGAQLKLLYPRPMLHHQSKGHLAMLGQPNPAANMTESLSNAPHSPYCGAAQPPAPARCHGASHSTCPLQWCLVKGLITYRFIKFGVLGTSRKPALSTAPHLAHLVRGRHFLALRKPAHSNGQTSPSSHLPGHSDSPSVSRQPLLPTDRRSTSSGVSRGQVAHRNRVPHWHSPRQSQARGAQGSCQQHGGAALGRLLNTAGGGKVKPEELGIEPECLDHHLGPKKLLHLHQRPKPGRLKPVLLVLP